MNNESHVKSLDQFQEIISKEKGVCNLKEEESVILIILPRIEIFMTDCLVNVLIFIRQSAYCFLLCSNKDETLYAQLSLTSSSFQVSFHFHRDFWILKLSWIELQKNIESFHSAQAALETSLDVLAAFKLSQTLFCEQDDLQTSSRNNLYRNATSIPRRYEQQYCKQEVLQDKPWDLVVSCNSS